MAKKGDAVQIIDGRWYAVGFGGEPWYEECCSCGLVHRQDYKVENGKFWVRYTVDDKRTRRARAKQKGR
jgi:hypothetical protein